MTKDFEIGDTLFGYPITKLSEDYVEVTIPYGGPQLTFDRKQFDGGVRYALALGGAWIPMNAAGA